MIRRSATAAILAGGMILASACGAAAAELSGEAMGWPWALPFVAVLLSIATGPLLFPKIWHAHYGKIAASWAGLTVLALARHESCAGSRIAGCGFAAPGPG